MSETSCSDFMEDGSGAGACTFVEGGIGCTHARHAFCNHNRVRPFPSSSGIDKWCKCRRAWWLDFVRGVRRKPEHLSTPMKMGRVWDSYQAFFFCGPEFDVTSVDWTSLDAFSRAKVSAVARAFSQLFDPDVLGAFGDNPCQKVSTRAIGPEGSGIVLTGHEDRIRSVDSFAECKFTGRPEFYEKILDIKDQLGAYFLLDPNFQVARMEVTRAPQLRYKDSGDPAIFEQRVYEDVLNRPAFYFIGYNKKAGTFGKSYYRSEINLEELERRILFMCQVEIPQALAFRDPAAAFYQRVKNCFMGNSPCEYYPICQTGHVNDEPCGLYITPESIAKEAANENL